MSEINSYNLTKRLERNKKVDCITDNKIIFCYNQGDIEKGKNIFGLNYEGDSLILGNDDFYCCPAKGMHRATNIPYMKALMFSYKDMIFSSLSTTLVGNSFKHFENVLCDSLYFNGLANTIVLDNFVNTNDSLSITLNADMIIIKNSIINCDSITLYGKVFLENCLIKSNYKYNIPEIVNATDTRIVKPKEKQYVKKIKDN